MLETNFGRRAIPENGHQSNRSGRSVRPLPATLACLAALLSAGTARPAFADDPLGFDQVVPVRFQYAQYARFHERKPPAFSFRRNELRAVEAPTRYRTSSILQYSRALGNTGLQLRVKAPLNPRKIIKVEIRF